MPEQNADVLPVVTAETAEIHVEARHGRLAAGIRWRHPSPLRWLDAHEAGHSEGRQPGHTHESHIAEPTMPEPDVVAALESAIAQLDAEHRRIVRAHPTHPETGCVVCWPKDGSWPCVTRQIADELRDVVERLR